MPYESPWSKQAQKIIDQGWGKWTDPIPEINTADKMFEDYFNKQCYKKMWPEDFSTKQKGLK